jgi:hypothetical protein
MANGEWLLAMIIGECAVKMFFRLREFRFILFFHCNLIFGMKLS